MANYNDYLNEFGSDKGTSPAGFPESANGYGYLYSLIFEEYRQIATHICEIGIHEGSSLKASSAFFESAEIHGLDIIESTQYENDRVKTHVVDQSSEIELIGFRESMKRKKMQFDIIIDDGSHDVSHQQLTFGILFELVKPGGLYVIEDLGSSFFTKGTSLYGYVQDETKAYFNTVNFLANRPLASPWIHPDVCNQIDSQIEHIITFDRVNRGLPYSTSFSTIGNYPIKSITSIIKKNGN
jgi:hypothetical protein